MGAETAVAGQSRLAESNILRAEAAIVSIDAEFLELTAKRASLVSQIAHWEQQKSSATAQNRFVETVMASTVVGVFKGTDI